MKTLKLQFERLGLCCSRRREEADGKIPDQPKPPHYFGGHNVLATALAMSWLLAGVSVFAGSSGLNVVVVVNQSSTNSVELGNYYCEKRGVPPQNVLRINWTGSATDWTRTNLDAVLRAPLNAMLASRQLSNQIDFVLLSMDIPYRVNENTGASATSGYNSTTSVLFYGFKPDGCDLNCPAGLPSCNLPSASSNAYAGSEAVFRQVPPGNVTSNSWLAVMLTASNLAQAKLIVDRGVVADATFPTQTVYLAKSYDPIRSLRYEQIDDGIFDTRLRAVCTVLPTNASSPAGLGSLLGFQIGVQLFAMSPNTFVPGAIADNLTSYSGDLFSSPDHTRVLDFIHAGATASYGTVVEPCAYLEKFASSRNYFYQARGFSIAECYYQSLTNPYQGIIVGEPLCAPFARPSTGNWTGLPGNAVLTGTTNLTLQFTAADNSRPIQQVDLFVDGNWVQTVTNLAPQSGNRLYVTLPGRTNLSYTVPAGASLTTIANGVAAMLTNPANNLVTKVDAFVHGDRVELRSTDINRPGLQTPVAVSNHVGSATGLSTYLQAAAPTFLDTTAYGRVGFLVSGPLVAGDTLTLNVTKTNGALVSVSVTNSDLSNLTEFVQLFASTIYSEPALQGVDGLMAEDLLGGFVAGNIPAVQFNLRARSPGIKAAQLQVTVTGTFSISPPGLTTLTGNLADLQPRNHLYVTAGRTNASFAFPFNTATQADGFHELTAVAYEGSHVRTQKRISQTVRIQNNPWSATFTTLVGDTNTALEANFQFAVAASTNNITRIELFTTGGLFATSNSVTSATFSVAATNLGIGLHPFYALVTRSDGTQYRTETKWQRIVGPDSPFPVTVAGVPPLLTWPAAAGRNYQVLSTTELTNTFTPRATVIPTNSFGAWQETNLVSPQRLYRIKSP